MGGGSAGREGSDVRAQKGEAVANNYAILSSLLIKVESEDEAKYTTACMKMAAWLGSDRAYYKEGQNHVCFVK